MKLTVKAKYGLSALAQVAREARNAPITGKMISAKQKISESYVEQVMLPLVAGGIVRTIRGSKGGYVLNKEAKDVTLLDIIELYEGKLDFADIEEIGNSTFSFASCPSLKVWKNLEEKFRLAASEFTLDDILEEFMNNYKEGEYAI